LGDQLFWSLLHYDDDDDDDAAAADDDSNISIYKMHSIIRAESEAQACH